MEKQDTSLFQAGSFDRGAGKLKEISWYLVKSLFFLTSIPYPSSFKKFLLILYGAKVGKSLYIRPRVNIHFPWKLRIGNYCWIGDRCEILNLEHVIFEDYVALAHDVYLAAASHDISSKSMQYANKPIYIESSVWIATRAFIGPGVRIKTNAVIGACCAIFKDVPENTVVTVNSNYNSFLRKITKP